MRRFSPACAGETRGGDRCAVCNAVQPRVCGGDATRITVDQTGVGSAPRVRGRPQIPVYKQALGRFSPACAGETR